MVTHSLQAPEWRLLGGTTLAIHQTGSITKPGDCSREYSTRCTTGMAVMGLYRFHFTATFAALPPSWKTMGETSDALMSH